MSYLFLFLTWEENQSIQSGPQRAVSHAGESAFFALAMYLPPSLNVSDHLCSPRHVCDSHVWSCPIIASKGVQAESLWCFAGSAYAAHWHDFSGSAPHSKSAMLRMPLTLGQRSKHSSSFWIVVVRLLKEQISSMHSNWIPCFLEKAIWWSLDSG